jgi:hypothetical protein
MKQFVGGHLHQRLYVPEGDEHPKQQEDALSIMFLWQSGHHEIPDCLPSCLYGVGTGIVEECAAERSDCVMNLEAIDAEDLNRAGRSKTSERSRRRGRLDAEGPLENNGSFGL